MVSFKTHAARRDRRGYQNFSWATANTATMRTMLSKCNQVIQLAEDRCERAGHFFQKVFDRLGPQRMSLPVGFVNRAVERYCGGEIVAFGGQQDRLAPESQRSILWPAAVPCGYIGNIR